MKTIRVTGGLALPVMAAAILSGCTKPAAEAPPPPWHDLPPVQMICQFQGVGDSSSSQSGVAGLLNGWVSAYVQSQTPPLYIETDPANSKIYVGEYHDHGAFNRDQDVTVTYTFDNSEQSYDKDPDTGAPETFDNQNVVKHVKNQINITKAAITADTRIWMTWAYSGKDVPDTQDAPSRPDVHVALDLTTGALDLTAADAASGSGAFHYTCQTTDAYVQATHPASDSAAAPAGDPADDGGAPVDHSPAAESSSSS